MTLLFLSPWASFSLLHPIFLVRIPLQPLIRGESSSRFMDSSRSITGVKLAGSMTSVSIPFIKSEYLQIKEDG